MLSLLVGAHLIQRGLPPPPPRARQISRHCFRDNTRTSTNYPQQHRRSRCAIICRYPYTKKKHNHRQLKLTAYLTWTVRMGCDTEARITAVERAQEYADLTPEAPAIVEDYRPPKV